MHNWVDKWVANCKSHWSTSTVIDNGKDVTTETTGWGRRQHQTSNDADDSLDNKALSIDSTLSIILANDIALLMIRSFKRESLSQDL